jgi:hypothetical protein
LAEGFINVTEGSGKKIHAFDRTIGANTVLGEVVVNGEQYLAEYSVTTITPISAATANSHPLQIMAGASLRLRIRRIEVAQMGLATTGAMCQWALYRLTTAGTGGTAITPQLLDPADAAAGATAMTLPSAKGTEGALLWSGSTPMTQTVTATPSNFPQPFIVLDFDGLRRKPVHVAAGTSNGIALKNITAIAAATVIVTAFFDESSFI